MEFDFRVSARDCDEHFTQFMTEHGPDHKLIGRKVTVLEPVPNPESHVEYYALIKLPSPLIDGEYRITFSPRESR